MKTANRIQMMNGGRFISHHDAAELYYDSRHKVIKTHMEALQREVLIAYQMNGRDLSEDHGFPVRAIVPGHYAMASVKWLTRIYAVREPFQGYGQTSDYGYWDYVDGKPRNE
jgi:DMSO/TMAO reductase YedYZ molybdopterin-dependent catalytic subunit